MIITSHWPEVMSDLSDYAIWIDKGEIVEEGDPETVVARFMEQVPAPEKSKEFEQKNPIIRMVDVKKHYYSIDRGVVKAVDGVDLTVYEGEIFGVVA